MTYTTPSRPVSFRTLRARTALIFFAGLFVLFIATLLVTLVVSQTIRYEDRRAQALDMLRGDVMGWVTAARQVSPALPLHIGPALLVVQDGGTLVLPGRPEQWLDSARDDEERAALDRALLAWRQLERDQTGDRAAALESALAVVVAVEKARDTVRAARDGNIGMVRGMYGALFLAGLIFLLIGLWLVQQTLVEPLEGLHQVAQRIAAGDLDTPVSLAGAGEFKELSASFEAMRTELAQSRNQLTAMASDLEVRVAQRAQQLAALSQVIGASGQSMELDTVLRTALDQTLQVMGLAMGGVWLYDEEAQRLTLAVHAGFTPAMNAELHTLRLGEGATGRAAALGRMVVLEDLTEARAIILALSWQEGVRGLVAAPITLRDRVLGVLTVMARDLRSFTPDEIALLNSVGQHTAIAVDGLRLLREIQQQARRVAALQERERIGGELHDGLLQTLGYLYLKSDQLEALAVARGLDAMAGELAAQRHLLEAASEDVRRFIADLRDDGPPPPAPLAAALADAVDRFRREQGVAVSLRADGEPLLLAADQVAHVVRIAGEALNNATRHGHATHAEVTLLRHDGYVELTVADDGCGFDVQRAPADGRPRFGLSVMQARAARVGGRLELSSRPGAGTTVRVRWPMCGSAGAGAGMDGE